MDVQPDRELVDAVISGEAHAFAALVRRYDRLVVTAATEILRDKHAAEDVAQEAFVTAYEKLNSLRDRSAFGAWLLKITRHCALRSARRQPRMQSLEQSTCDTLPQNGRLDDRSQELLHLVQRLPQHERTVVLLKYFDDHSVAEIAVILGQNVGTVTKKLTRARQRLEVWLAENEQ